MAALTIPHKTDLFPHLPPPSRYSRRPSRKAQM